jgi:hypothetical protein
MKKFIREAGVFLLLTLSAMVIADEPGYRIAGIIASGAADWGAIVELPDGEQKLVSAGDFLGQVEIVRISKEGVVLQLPGGERQMQLSQGGYIPLSDVTVDRTGVLTGDFNRRQVKPSQGGDIATSAAAVPRSSGSIASGTGVAAADFSKRVEKQLTSHQVASVRGLEILSSLSESARIVSFSSLDDPEASHTPIDSLSAGVNLLQQAIIEGEALRISVEGDESFTDFYVMPNPAE